MRKIQVLSLLCGVALLAACSSSPKMNMASEAQPMADKPAAQQPMQAPMAASTPVAMIDVPPHLDPKNALSTTRSVYFDYDNFAVKPEFQAVLDMHGKYLAKNSKLVIRVEGNTDERGSTEYNLALGQKRADAVVRVLKLHGVKDGQMEAVSWGKEKPQANGDNETAFEQNRRVDLVYPK